MDTITTKCALCGATNNTFVQPDVEWMSRVRRMERENAAFLTACRDLVEALARARKADDNVYRAATDPSEALFDEQEDAHATLIICENEVRKIIKTAGPTRAAIDAAEQE